MNDKDAADDDYQWPYSEAAKTATGLLPAGSPVLFELVGSITTVGAYIEDGLRHIFCWLAEPYYPQMQEPWQLISNGQQLKWLVDYSIALGDLKYGKDPWWAPLKEHIKRAQGAMDKHRNPVVHASFATDGDDTWAVRSRLRKMTPDRFPATAEDLRDRYKALASAYAGMLVQWWAADNMERPSNSNP